MYTFRTVWLGLLTKSDKTRLQWTVWTYRYLQSRLSFNLLDAMNCQIGYDSCNPDCDPHPTFLKAATYFHVRDPINTGKI